ncbi:hypothetical protein BAE44_0004339, partial [Dichanthelium oligosanthes]
LLFGVAVGLSAGCVQVLKIPHEKSARGPGRRLEPPRATPARARLRRAAHLTTATTMKVLSQVTSHVGRATSP